MHHLKNQINYAWVVLIILFGFITNVNAQQNADYALAKSYFKEIDSLCNIDDGKLWGVHLNGPIMLVFSDTRTIIANQADNDKKLKEKDGVFTRKLPDNINIANTSLVWNGQQWTMVMWDALSTTDKYMRDYLFIHESWHRVQDKIGIVPLISTNTHLDELQGTVLIKLELRALHKALVSKNSEEKVEAIKDALFFRAYRQSLFPTNNENSFERHEGMAEYTGNKLCGLSDKYLPIVMAKRLQLGESNDGFANSFAYLTGPAYGFLLDSLYPTWIKQIIAGENLPFIIKNSLKLEIPTDTIKMKLIIDTIGNKYNAKELLMEETLKFEQQAALLNYYKDNLIENEQLIIQNNNLNFTYNPQEKQIHIDKGVVYKTMRLTGEWGILEVKNGILRTDDWKFFIVAAPKKFAINPITEEDYTLNLNQGWSVVKVKDKKYMIKKK
ncbi:MAG: hypothetical protein AUJ97_01930 [Bacteroidetes bacterium CG2_30_32_10]|nr:MAG: hypothetical protein AUJ97_01930 [Bacteroidetes bacterium CG2_30_32_10]